MKKIIVAVFLLLCFMCIGCGGYDKLKCYESVEEKYPTGRIIQLPDLKYRYVVILEDCEIRYVQTMNQTNTDISHDIRIK